MKTLTTLLAGAALAASIGLALAQETADPGAMEDMDHSNMAEGTAMHDMMMAMDTMIQNMPQQSSGVVDADFLLMMIPHHQSAIDMARIEVEQGQDEETKAMAQQIMGAQEAEIAEMRAMLERTGVEAPAPAPR
jgi:uncharacterized protein (DUF305 family)